MSNLFLSLPTKVADAITPAETVGDLPTDAQEGAIRYVKDEDTLYTFNGSAWAPSAGDPNAVVGPGAAVTANSVVRWDGTSGTDVKDSLATIDDGGNLVATSVSGNPLAVHDGTNTINLYIDGASASYDLTLPTAQSGDEHSLVGSSTGPMQFVAVPSPIQDELDLKVASDLLGVADGVATLDSGGKIPAAQLPNSIMEYKGTWAPSTNTPTLANGTGNAGDVYIASDAGTVNFGAGAVAFTAGDWAVYSGSIWEKSVNSNAVASVNGYTGAVVLGYSDFASNSALTIQDAFLEIQDNADNTKRIKWQLSNLTTGVLATFSPPPLTSSAGVVLVGTQATQSISNKTFGSTNTFTLQTDKFVFQEASSNQQELFDLTALTATRTAAFPDEDITIVGEDSTQTLTNKTLGSTNDISGATASNFTVSGLTVTLPALTTTLVGTNTTASMTNKTFTGSTNTFNVVDNKFEVWDDGDNSKRFNFNATNIATSTTRTYGVPNADTTLVGDNASQTLTNKTIDGSSNTLTVLAGTQLSGQTPAANGGTGLDTSASTGVAKVASGTWSVAAIVNADVDAAAAISGSKIEAASGATSGVVTGSAQTFDGVKTFTDGIALGNETLSVYDESSTSTTFSDNGTGPGTSGSVTLRLVRIGDIVTVYVPLFSLTVGTGSVTTLTNNTTLGSNFRPATTTQVITAGQPRNNGSADSVVGSWNINTNGTIAFRRTPAGAWTAGTSCGLANPTTFSYYVGTGS